MPIGTTESCEIYLTREQVRNWGAGRFRIVKYKRWLAADAAGLPMSERIAF